MLSRRRRIIPAFAACILLTLLFVLCICFVYVVLTFVYELFTLFLMKYVFLVIMCRVKYIY